MSEDKPTDGEIAQWVQQQIASHLETVQYSDVAIPKFMSLGFHGRVLELGCNISPWYPLFMKLGVEYCGVDHYETILQSARAFFRSHHLQGGNFLRCRAQCMPFPSECFDYVFSPGFLRNFPNQRKPEATGEIRRVLKKDGFLIINEYRYPAPYPVQATDGRSFTLAGWENFDSDFRCISNTETLPFLVFRDSSR